MVDYLRKEPREKEVTGDTIVELIMRFLISKTPPGIIVIRQKKSITCFDFGAAILKLTPIDLDLMSTKEENNLRRISAAQMNIENIEELISSMPDDIEEDERLEQEVPQAPCPNNDEGSVASNGERSRLERKVRLKDTQKKERK